jgi:uncharacterized lipoprotein YddW (UPF0748 family)
MKLALRIAQFAIFLALVSPLATAQEVRALWVVRTTLTSPEKIRQLVNSAADNGFNTLIVQIRGRGDAYYKSRVEPRAIELKDQPATFDPLALTLEEAHKRGVKVHGWLNTNLLANLDALPIRAIRLTARRSSSGPGRIVASWKVFTPDRQIRKCAITSTTSGWTC